MLYSSLVNLIVVSKAYINTDYSKYKNIHIYTDISRRKECAANYSGDGPLTNLLSTQSKDSSSTASTFHQTNIDLLSQNEGITVTNVSAGLYNEANFHNEIELQIRRTRQNCPFKVIRINKPMILSKTGKDVNIGDIIVKINNVDISSYANKQAIDYLSSIELFSIHNYTPLEWAQISHNNRNSTRMNSSNSALLPLSNNNAHNNLNLHWDYDNVCPHCSCLFLKVKKKRYLLQ